MLISLFLFQFGCFALSVESFNQFTPKVCILVQQYHHLSSESVLLAQHEVTVCPKHAFMLCWIAVQYVARVLHFSASTLKNTRFLSN